MTVFGTLADHLKPERRSWNMAQVRSRNTSPEKRVRRMLVSLKVRHTSRAPNLPGTPDVILPDHKLAIFVHGCFWHRHRGCSRTSWPKTHRRFWKNKFAENVCRDRHVLRAIRKKGWSAAVVWECQTKNVTLLRKLIERRIGRG